mmetsp:Transcript_72808/g.210791  ORF Transcript_72808/g.210791 Transcript_72808/m.210791 type:complete len:229 (+) Transcript_72808:227-913(+)
MRLSVCKLRSKCKMRSPSSTRKNHHSSSFSSGNKGALAGPIASSRRRCVLASTAWQVATSPTTISLSSSTSIAARSSTSPTCEQKASTSASCAGDIVAPNSARLRSAPSARKSVSPEQSLQQTTTCSSEKCGTCNNSELRTSNACTTARRKSIMARAAANHSRMQATSIIACVTIMDLRKISSQSRLSSGDIRSCRRCKWAQTMYWFFITIGNEKLRRLCSTTCPASR